MSDGNPDVMDTLAGLAEASPLSALRRQRPDPLEDGFESRVHGQELGHTNTLPP